MTVRSNSVMDKVRCTGWLAVLGLMLWLDLPSAHAEDASIQSAFNARYRNYFGSESQSLLPFSTLEKPAWQELQQTRKLEEVYREADKYYNSKVYTFTLYRDVQNGQYYLDAKGGFWGMDELIYGPIDKAELL